MVGDFTKEVGEATMPHYKHEVTFAQSPLFAFLTLNRLPSVTHEATTRSSLNEMISASSPNPLSNALSTTA